MVKFILPSPLFYNRVSIAKAKDLFDYYKIFLYRAIFKEPEEVLKVWFGDPHPINLYFGPHNIYWTLKLHDCDVMIIICHTGRTGEDARDKQWEILAPNKASIYTAMNLISFYQKSSNIRRTRNKIYVTNNQEGFNPF